MPGPCHVRLLFDLYVYWCSLWACWYSMSESTWSSHECSAITWPGHVTTSWPRRRVTSSSTWRHGGHLSAMSHRGTTTGTRMHHFINYDYSPFFVFCFSVIFAYVCYTRNVINVTIIGRQISELMFLWWPAILYSVLKSVCLLMANKWMMMIIIITMTMTIKNARSTYLHGATPSESYRIVLAATHGTDWDSLL